VTAATTGGEIGRARPRPESRRLAAGRGRYTDDIPHPAALHAAFLRSPHPHARIGAIDVAAAAALPGVAAVLTGEDLARVCKPFQTVTGSAPGLVSPPQRALAIGEAVFQGEPVVMALAASRARAEDALELVEVAWDPLPAATDLATALSPGAPPVHAAIPSNLSWRTEIAGGDAAAAAAFAAAALVVEERFDFARHTGVPLESRAVLAEYDPAEGRMLVHLSHQMPHQMQLHLSDLLGIPMGRLRVVCPDVGGAFGIKLHVYPEEIAACAAARLLGRAVRFTADRAESLVSDVHAREARIAARMAFDAEGRVLGMEVDYLQGTGAYSVHPRSSVIEAMGALRCMGAPYRLPAYRGALLVAMQNKTPTGQYRAVGHPIACTVTERLMDKAAEARGEDPWEIRRRNLVGVAEMPCTNAAGARLFDLSPIPCLDKAAGLMDLPALREEVAAMRAAGRVVGLGVAAFVEFTAAGPERYGRAGVPVAAVDSVAVTLEPSGEVTARASVSELGQGIATGLAQVIAEAVGLPFAQVVVETGDTGSVPHGGGAWSSRGAAIGGEAAWGAGRRLRAEILATAAALLQSSPGALDIADGQVVEAATGTPRLSLAEVAEVALFRGYELPDGVQPQLSVTHHHRREAETFLPTNGVQASLVELDPGTGLVRVLRHWVAEDCGRVLNPLLVDEQIRGGVVQGLGEALLEACRYDAVSGQFLSGTLADYLLPMAAEMPDIQVAHVETPYAGSVLGAKGAGEAGTCGAPAAVLNAVNDALRAAGATARIATLPIPPVEVLAALEGAGR
jgi:carbon-monoxide dehydrogenase large subunit